jgi:hypothetical protein
MVVLMEEEKALILIIHQERLHLHMQVLAEELLISE